MYSQKGLRGHLKESKSYLYLILNMDYHQLCSLVKYKSLIVIIRKENQKIGEGELTYAKSAATDMTQCFKNEHFGINRVNIFQFQTLLLNLANQLLFKNIFKRYTHHY